MNLETLEVTNEYTKIATSGHPGLLVLLVDQSASMGLPLHSRKDSGDDDATVGAVARTRIDVLNDGVEELLDELFMQCTKPDGVRDRFRIAMFAYDSEVLDLLGNGAAPLSEVIDRGSPEFVAQGNTDTAAGLRKVVTLLEQEIAGMGPYHPAPVVCHITDGCFNLGGSPEPLAEQIRGMSTPDGNVLLYNIYIGDELDEANIGPLRQWTGIVSEDQLHDDYAKALFRMSSPMPRMIHSRINELGFPMDAASMMLFPGNSIEMLRHGLAVTGETMVTRGGAAQ